MTTSHLHSASRDGGRRFADTVIVGAGQAGLALAGS
jgi:cation diffusion facilitator CzcD-associated flavoprotein CzcO